MKEEGDAEEDDDEKEEKEDIDENEGADEEEGGDEEEDEEAEEDDEEEAVSVRFLSSSLPPSGIHVETDWFCSAESSPKAQKARRCP